MNTSIVAGTRNNFLLIPGNPPARHFYDLWRSELLARFPGSRAEVSPYPIVEAEPDHQAALAKIAAFHAACLESFQRSVRGPVTILGHSLGGYFAMRLLEAHPDLVKSAILIHPFLRAPTARGRAILRGVSVLHGRPKLQGALLGVRGMLARRYPELSHVHDSELRSCLNLVRHEHREIGQDRSPLRIPTDFRAKVGLIYSPGDTWCSPVVVSALKEQVRTFECGSPHDFIVSAQQRSQVAERLMPWIQEGL